jgi:hypothetical protein
MVLVGFFHEIAGVCLERRYSAGQEVAIPAPPWARRRRHGLMPAGWGAA